VSKAFTRESDADAGDPVLSGPAVPLPPGAKNYLTPAGARRLTDRLARLAEQRNEAAGIADPAERRRRLQEIDGHIRLLTGRLAIAEVVDLTAQPPDRVRFGATVTVREEGVEHRYRIVGVDEAEPERGRVSWLSPLAKALLNVREGEVVTFRSPGRTRELEILRIAYEGD
jgi:transcription elongation factor GreB